MGLVLRILFALYLSGCAYTWGHKNRGIPGGYKTVYVKMFENRTSDVGVEAGFTQALMVELERAGFIAVTSKNAAELILEGTVLNITSNPGSITVPFRQVNHVGSAQQCENADGICTYDAPYADLYILNVSANLRAVRAVDKSVVWQTSISRSKNFRGALLTRQGVRSSNVLYNQSRKKQTIQLIAKDMMREAFDRLTENF